MPITQKRNSTARSLARGLPQGTFNFGELVEFISWDKAEVSPPVSAPPAIGVEGARPAPDPVAAKIGDEVTQAPPFATAPLKQAKRTKPKRARISFEVPARLNAELEKMARAQDRTKTTILRDALTRYLKAPSAAGGEE